MSNYNFALMDYHTNEYLHYQNHKTIFLTNVETGIGLWRDYDAISFQGWSLFHEVDKKRVRKIVAVEYKQ